MEHKPDLLGRTLDPEYTRGFLKWSARSGSKTLVARTEARPRQGRDTFGFNCTSCCGEVPSGLVVPSTVEFFVGATPSFQTAAQIDTCNGSMGPFPTTATSLTTPTPFSWNGAIVGASAPAKETASFHGMEEGTFPGTVCVYQQMPIFGLGGPDSCKTLLKKVHKPIESWSNSQACTQQVGSEPPNKKCERCNACCSGQRAYRLCRHQNQEAVEHEYQVCQGLCLVDHCA